MKVRAIEREGGVRRAGSVRVDDHGRVESEPRGENGREFVAVYWPGRYVNTVEDVRDIEEVEP